MSAIYFFQDFARFEHLEEFLRVQIQTVVDHFIPGGKYQLVTRIHTTRARGEVRRPRFLCEIRLDAPQNTSAIVIKKKSFSFHKAVFQVSDVLRKVLRRQSSFRAQHHRREHRRMTSRLQRDLARNERRIA